MKSERVRRLSRLFSVPRSRGTHLTPPRTGACAQPALGWLGRGGTPAVPSHHHFLTLDSPPIRRSSRGDVHTRSQTKASAPPSMLEMEKMCAGRRECGWEGEAPCAPASARCSRTPRADAAAGFFRLSLSHRSPKSSSPSPTGGRAGAFFARPDRAALAARVAGRARASQGATMARVFFLNCGVRDTRSNPLFFTRPSPAAALRAVNDPPLSLQDMRHPAACTHGNRERK